MAFYFLLEDQKSSIGAKAMWVEFGNQPLTIIQIVRIRDKFKSLGTVMKDRTVENLLKLKNVNVILLSITRSPQKSLGQCFCETEIKKEKVYGIPKIN